MLAVVSGGLCSRTDAAISRAAFDVLTHDEESATTFKFDFYVL